MDDRGILVILSGFSGSGKGTMVKRLLELYPDDYALSISATTRNPRDGEAQGREYFFKTRQEFEELIESDGLLEYAEYVGNYYGTPKDYVLEKLSEGKNVILEIEIQGALKVKEKYPDALLLFTAPPSADALKERLIGRGTESPEVIMARLARAAKEADSCEAYDYLIVNDILDDAVNDINAAVITEKNRIKYGIELIGNIKEDIVKFLKGEA